MSHGVESNRVHAIGEALYKLGHVESAAQVDESTGLFNLPGKADRDGLGIDSLGMLELVVTLEDEFSLSLPRDVDNSQIQSVGGLARHLIATSSGHPGGQSS